MGMFVGSTLLAEPGVCWIDPMINRIGNPFSKQLRDLPRLKRRPRWFDTEKVVDFGHVGEDPYAKKTPKFGGKHLKRLNGGPVSR